MAHDETPDFSVALELGSSHASILVTQPGAVGEPLNIMAYASIDTSGMRKGHIVHFDSLVTGIQDLVDEAERQTGLTLENARINVTGPIAAADNYTETTPIRHGEVRPADMERLHAAARTNRALAGWEYIHLLATQYTLDGKSGLVSPVGLIGNQLSCHYHRVSFPQNDLRNLVKACNQAGIHVESFVFEALAAAESVLDADERELGAACLSIGHDLTHVAIYANGHPIFSKGYPLGSNHITKDMAVGLRLTQSDAERLKRDFGNAMPTSEGSRDLITGEESRERGGRRITRGEIGHIVAPRITEILETVRDDISRSGLSTTFSKGLVLTGAGALLNGICLAAEDVFKTTARIGCPTHLSGLTEGVRSPGAAGVVGLLASRFALPDTEPGFLDKMGALRSAGGFKALARGLWERIAEPFES